MHIRGEIINLRIILDCIFRLKFKFQDYINFYVNKVNPKIIITFLDNYPQVYAIDHKAKKIVIQNAFRTGPTNFDRIKKVVKGSGLFFVTTNLLVKSIENTQNLMLCHQVLLSQIRYQQKS